MNHSQLIELELALFSTGKFSSRREARKEAVKKAKLIEANKKAANDKNKVPPNETNFAEF